MVADTLKPQSAKSGQGTGGRGIIKRKKDVSLWVAVLLAQMKVKFLEFLASADVRTNDINDKCGSVVILRTLTELQAQIKGCQSF